MPLESGSYINDLVTTNPTSGDPKSQGDDHLRLIKSTLRVTFSGFLGAVMVRGPESGTGAAYVVTPATAIPSLQVGMRVVFSPTNTNTGAATLAVSGLTAAPVIHGSGFALSAGDVLAGQVLEVVYTGAAFQIVGGSGYLSRTGNQAINGTLTLGAGGSLDFSAGRTQVRTLAAGSPDSNDAVSVAMLNQTALSVVLPGQSGQAGKFLQSNGTTATWQIIPKPSIARSPRTSNTQITASDSTTLVDITSGTFAQTFATAATLGAGWYCYVRNAGSGDITVTPAAGETIDGLSSYVMYPGEVRLFLCDGTTLRSIVLVAFFKVFTASGDFIKPPGYAAFEGELLGGGGSGFASTTVGAGGGGGGCTPLRIVASFLAAIQAVVVGAGALVGGSSGSTTFAGVIGNGGQGGNGTATTAGGTSLDSTGSAIYRGGGGGFNNGGAPSMYGGGGGAGFNASSAPGGTSVTAGNGGAMGQPGTAPAGGGGLNAPGARGECRIWGVI